MNTRLLAKVTPVRENWLLFGAGPRTWCRQGDDEEVCSWCKADASRPAASFPWHCFPTLFLPSCTTDIHGTQVCLIIKQRSPVVFLLHLSPPPLTCSRFLVLIFGVIFGKICQLQVPFGWRAANRGHPSEVEAGSFDVPTSRQHLWPQTSNPCSQF